MFVWEAQINVYIKICFPVVRFLQYHCTLHWSYSSSISQMNCKGKSFIFLWNTLSNRSFCATVKLCFQSPTVPGGTNTQTAWVRSSTVGAKASFNPLYCLHKEINIYLFSMEFDASLFLIYSWAKNTLKTR